MAKDSEVKLDKQERESKESVVSPLVINANFTFDDLEIVISKLKSVQRETKKATQAVKELDTIAKAIEQKDEVATLLDLADKYGFLLTASTQHKSRGIGKTHALVNKAIKENLAIVVSGNSYVEYIKKTFDFDNVFSCRALRIHALLRKFDGFLVDDLVPLEIVAEIMEKNTSIELKGGFVADKTTIVLGNLRLPEDY